MTVGILAIDFEWHVKCTIVGVKYFGSDHLLCIVSILTSAESGMVKRPHLDDDCMEEDYELDYGLASAPLTWLC